MLVRAASEISRTNSGEGSRKKASAARRTDRLPYRQERVILGENKIWSKFPTERSHAVARLDAGGGAAKAHR